MKAILRRFSNPTFAALALLGVAATWWLSGPNKLKPPTGGQGIATSTDPAGEEEATNLLARAVDRVESIGGLHVRMRGKINLFEEELFTAGRYAHDLSASQDRFLLELRTQISDDVSILKLVGDGNYLWTDTMLPSARSISRMNQADFLQGSRLNSNSQFALDVPRPRQPRTPFGQLIQFVEREYAFAAPHAGKWGGEPSWILVGTRPRKTSAIPDQSADDITPIPEDQIAKAPRLLPPVVKLTLSQADLFLLRVDWYAGSRYGPILESATGDRSLDLEEGRIAIEFYDPRRLEPSDARALDYSPPPEVPWIDTSSSVAWLNDVLRR